MTYQEAFLQPPEDHAERLERMLSSQSLCDLEETIKRCRQLPGRLDAASLEVLERATTRLEVKSVETEVCRRLAGRTGGAWSPRKLASNGLRFTQQGSMLTRLADAATIDPEGAAAQKQLEADLAEAATDTPIQRPVNLRATQAPSTEGGSYNDTPLGGGVTRARSGLMWKQSYERIMYTGGKIVTVVVDAM